MSDRFASTGEEKEEVYEDEEMQDYDIDFEKVLQEEALYEE